MPKIRLLSAVEQVAAILREEMLRGQWSGLMPGVDTLAVELGVSRKTTEAALRLLEKEGLLVGQGPRRKRRIEIKPGTAPPALRIAILADETATRRPRYIVEAMHELVEAGHTASFAPGNMAELGKNPKRIARMVGKTEADAWVVMSGPRDVLEWFSEQGKPTLAVFGRHRGLPIAGVEPDKEACYTTAARELISLGHSRIVLLARRMRRFPEPGEPEQAFLRELDAHGISSGTYNLPDWVESVDGFHARLDSLFRITPPTALIVDEAPLFSAVQQFLSQRKILIPQDVSLVCTDADATFAWCKPSIAHMRWETQPLVGRITKWAARIARGKKDIRQSVIPAKFVTGGTMGRAKG
ncbi:substrate-binding domain-containing protein [Akkermansiaceae bacterium]|nr:substrate-binding domain-containing protein [Akkermansiaceae bacterium]